MKWPLTRTFTQYFWKIRPPVLTTQSSEVRPVRVRFAPSPTGMLHIGGARTALFNWAFAKRHGGTFILRIEDTDTERNSQESLDSILSSMKWLGLDWQEGPENEGDFGPYFQSQRKHLYDQALKNGMEEGWLYPCFCSAERVSQLKEEQRARKENPRYDRLCLTLSSTEVEGKLAAGESHVIRFAVPADLTVEIQDHIRGKVQVSSSQVEDWVVVRSNGMPTYNFCCVVDDAGMQISHVIRGEEHLSNTPKQVLLYQALQLPQPEYAHVPLILGGDGKKLSKRTGDTALADYIAKGYPQEALLNFLGLLGFSIDDATTVFSMPEMIQAFDLKRINPSGAFFDTDKLHWLCGDWMRRFDVDVLTQTVLPWLQASGVVEGRDLAWITSLVAGLQERAQLYGDFAEKASFLVEPLDWDEAALKVLTGDKASAVLAAIQQALQAEADFPPADFPGLAKAVAAEMEIGMGKVMKPVRVALTGALGGPDLGQVFSWLGRDMAFKRLQDAAKLAATS